MKHYVLEVSSLAYEGDGAEKTLRSLSGTLVGDRGSQTEAVIRIAAERIRHWEHGGRPFCGVRGAQAALVEAEEDVTCKRCLERIGCQDSPGGGGSRGVP